MASFVKNTLFPVFFTNDVDLDMFSTFIMIEDNYSLKWIEITSFAKNTKTFTQCPYCGNKHFGKVIPILVLNSSLRKFSWNLLL